MLAMMLRALTYGSLGAAAVCVAAGAWRALRGRGRLTGCMGPEVRGWRRLLPTRLFVSTACGYDLAGLPTDAQGRSTCPECGRVGTAVKLARGKWRLWRLAALLVAIGLSPGTARYVRSGAWAGWMPTDVLLTLKPMMGAWAGRTGRAVASEIDGRVAGGELSDRLKRRAAWSYTDDMRDDDIRGNAQTAMYELEERLKDVSEEPLVAALKSSDRQQRQIAANILQRRDHEPTEDLLRVTLEGLADDQLPSDDEHYTYVFNLVGGVEYFQKHGQVAEPYLKTGMEHGDEQTKFACATVAAMAKREALYPRAAELLIPHLASNDLENDALWAVSALVSMGPAAIKPLTRVLTQDDAQAQALAELIIRRIRVGGNTPFDVPKNSPARISGRAGDPTVLGDLPFYPYRRQGQGVP